MLNAHQIKILGIISKAKWRLETTLCRDECGEVNHPQTEDALFELVSMGLLEWFGPDDDPLKYKITPKGHQQFTKTYSNLTTSPKLLIKYPSIQ